MTKSGYFLIEYAIALALLVLLVTLSFQFADVYNRCFVRAEVEKLHSLCLYLQRKARIENSAQYLAFDTSNNSYQSDSIKHKLTNGVIFGFIEDVKGPPSAPLYSISNSVTFKESKIVFHPDGTIGAGTIYLTDRRKSCLYALTSGIAQVSHLRVYKFDKKWTLVI